MKKINLILISIFFIFTFFVFYLSLNNEQIYDTEDLVGKKITEVELNLFEGNGTFNTKEISNYEFTLINFWASWCAPCRKEHKNLIRLSKNKNLKIFYSKYKPVNIDRYKDKKICAFAGIGNPSNFFDLLKENKLNLINTISFPDHYKLSMSDHEYLLSNSKDVVLLTTEKDHCRIDDDYKKNIEFLKIELEIDNKDSFAELIKKNI